MNFTKDKHCKKKGFTIVELVIVVAVIGILSAILIPSFSNLIQTSKNLKISSDFDSVYEIFIINNQDYDIEKEDIYFAQEDYLYHYSDQTYKIVTDSKGNPLLVDYAESLGCFETVFSYNDIKIYTYNEDYFDNSSDDVESDENNSGSDDIHEPEKGTEEYYFEMFCSFIAEKVETDSSLEINHLLIGYIVDYDARIFKIYFVSKINNEYEFEYYDELTEEDLLWEDFEMIDSNEEGNIYLFEATV